MADATDSLLILWTGADREVALNMGLMYGLNAKLRGWFDEVVLLIWGPADLLLLDDADLQVEVGRMQEAGVRTLACRACADRYGVAERLEHLGIEVLYTGEFLSDWLKAGKRLLAL
jgi:hypothetical protein